jgi:serine O-acetyltransferase
MDKITQEDLYRYFPEPYSLGVFFKGLRAQGFRYVYLMRLAAKSNTFIKLIIRRVLLRRYVYKYGFQIPYNTQIGGGFHISHFGTIIINGLVVIGRNCNVNPGVVIGQTNRGKRMGCPTLGDRVWVGANAVIVGKIIIGNDVLIAPGAFVNFDVPDHSIVIGNPGKITQAENATHEYICHVLEDDF